MRFSATTSLVLLGAGVAFAQQTVTVVFRDGDSPTASYAGTRDVSVQTSPFFPDGGRDIDTLSVDGSPLQKVGLVYFDLSALPPGTPIRAVRFDVSVSSSANTGYRTYEALRAWSAPEVSWTRARAGQVWGAPGAAAASDRGSEVIAQLRTANNVFTDAGVDAVQRWIDSPATNFGFLVSDTHQDGFDFASCNAASNRPRLRLTLADGGLVDFQNGASPTSAYAGCTDAFIANAPDPNGNANGWGMIVANSANGNDINSSAFLFWDISSLPRGATVASASLLLGVLDEPSGIASVYEPLRDWTETGATWTRYDGTTAWATPGGRSSTDRGSSPLGRFAVSAPGPLEIPLFDAGVAMVQGWVEGSNPNRGLAVVAPSAYGDLLFCDREYPIAAQRPGLKIVYLAPDGGEAGAGGGTGTDAGAGTGLPTAGVFGVGCGCSSVSWAHLLGVPVAVTLRLRRRMRADRRG